MTTPRRHRPITFTFGSRGSFTKCADCGNGLLRGHGKRLWEDEYLGTVCRGEPLSAPEPPEASDG